MILVAKLEKFKRSILYYQTFYSLYITFGSLSSQGSSYIMILTKVKPPYQRQGGSKQGGKDNCLCHGHIRKMPQVVCWMLFARTFPLPNFVGVEVMVSSQNVVFVAALS
jgi:hypothetical protein